MANWFGHLLHRNSLLKYVNETKIEWRIEVTRRQVIRSKQLLDDLKEKRGYCKLKEEAIDLTVWRTRCGNGCEPVLRQTAWWQRQWWWWWCTYSHLSIETGAVRLLHQIGGRILRNMTGLHSLSKTWRARHRYFGNISRILDINPSILFKFAFP